ncbi:MAG: FliM/FliN family flagellar motor switch protein [Spirochaetales bacterium]|nr:FliM/FliN family flagellar motor switch protein [Spirochaetales bacterium]
MKNFFQIKGQLSLCIGKGYLSSFEVSTLKKGDVVKSSQLAGYPYPVYFNGLFLCQGEVVVLRNLFGIRVTGLSPDPYDRQGPVLAYSDDVIELLPTRIQLGTINVSLAELEHIGPGSFINLDVPYNTEQDAELLAAGIPVAAGKTIVFYENMGIRITGVYNNQFESANVRTSGFIIDSEHEEVKDYNFTRPDKFTRNTIMKIKDIHELFYKNIRVRETVFNDFTLEVVDQCTFGEAMDILSKEDLTFIIARAAPWERNYERVEDKQKSKVKRILEQEGNSHPLDQETKAYIEKTLYSNGTLLAKPVIIFFKEKYFSQYARTGTKDLDFFISCLRGGWKNFVDINFQISGVGKSGKDLPGLNANEMIVIIKIVHKDNPDNYMVFIYPYITLESVIELLN